MKVVNVAPSSQEGHYLKGAVSVVNLDSKTESFYVEGESVLTTKNHTDLNIESDCIITCQQVYNPVTKMMERSKD